MGMKARILAIAFSLVFSSIISASFGEGGVVPAGRSHGTESHAPEIRDIRDPLPLAIPLPFLVAGCSAVVLSGVGALFLYGKRRKPAAGIHPETTANGPETALHELRDKYLQLQLDNPLLYLELSLLVRNVLQARTGIPALSLTTEELLQRVLAERLLASDQSETLRDFLLHCDAVKFAAHDPSPQQIENCFSLAAEFIRFMGEAQS